MTTFLMFMQVIAVAATPFAIIGAGICFWFVWLDRDSKDNESKKIKNACLIAGVICIIVALIGGLLIIGDISDNTGSSSSGGDSERCGICNTTYSDRDNVKSINHTNMCKRCYKNYKYASGS